MLLDSLTCSSLGQSCPAPSCLPDDPVWRLACDSLFPNHESAALYLRLRTPHMGALWSGKRTAEDDNKISWDKLNLNQLLLTCSWFTRNIPFWPHHKFEAQVLWLEPEPERWDTAYDGRTSHSPAWERPKQKAFKTEAELLAITRLHAQLLANKEMYSNLGAGLVACSASPGPSV